MTILTPHVVLFSGRHNESMRCIDFRNENHSRTQNYAFELTILGIINVARLCVVRFYVCVCACLLAESFLCVSICARYFSLKILFRAL